MSQSGYLFLGLTAIVAALSGVLAYAILRIFAAARAATRDDRKAGSETAFMAAAMEDAVRKLRDGERAMKARAEASERLSGEIVASLTAADAGRDQRQLHILPAHGQPAAWTGAACVNWCGHFTGDVGTMGFMRKAREGADRRPA